jgi:hypothetical protein
MRVHRVHGSQLRWSTIPIQQHTHRPLPRLKHSTLEVNQTLPWQYQARIQKKLTGFTMLHDAMLQYFLVCEPGTEQASDFLEHLKPDPTTKEGEDADNCEFTFSPSLLYHDSVATPSPLNFISISFYQGPSTHTDLRFQPSKHGKSSSAYAPPIRSHNTVHP